jgi:hypothetical protein
MKKLVLTTLVCLMVMGLSSSAFAANVFTLIPSTYDRLYQLLEGPLSTNANTFYPSVPSLVSGGSFAPSIGYFPDDSDPTNMFGWIRLGVNDTGDSSTYGLPTGYVGSAETVSGIGAINLSDYDAYAVNFHNANDDIWASRLYLKTASNEYWSSWVWTTPGASAGAYLDISGIADRNDIKAIGFEIGSNMTGVGGYPSDSDTAHMKVSPVPEPSSMALLGMGILGLFGLGRKRKV